MSSLASTTAITVSPVVALANLPSAPNFNSSFSTTSSATNFAGIVTISPKTG